MVLRLTVRQVWKLFRKHINISRSLTMIEITIEFIGLLLLAAGVTASAVTPAARSDLAPIGKLRAGINLENVLLAVKDPSMGEVRGIAVDLARELGRRIGVPV